MTDADPDSPGRHADFETLAARSGVETRRTVHEVEADRFARLREKFADPHWAVGAVVTDDAGCVLLVREDGEWLAPGGEVEPGESHAEALVREVREETGVAVEVGSLVAVTDVTFRCDGRSVGFYFAHYTATPTATALAVDPGTDGEGIKAVRWLASVPAETVDREVVVGNR